MDRDPVCGMTVSSSIELRCNHRGVEYLFCSQGCLERFTATPDTFLDSWRVRPDKTLSESAERYICPMCSGISGDEPGICPKCGMALEPF